MGLGWRKIIICGEKNERGGKKGEQRERAQGCSLKGNQECVARTLEQGRGK